MEGAAKGKPMHLARIRNNPGLELWLKLVLVAAVFPADG